MASRLEFVEYIAEQLQDAGEITFKKMFGEYGLYCNGKFFATICEDQFFVKVTKAGEEAFPDLPKAPPYAGAKDSFLVEDIDDKALLTKLTSVTCAALPTPKPKKKAKAE